MHTVFDQQQVTRQIIGKKSSIKYVTVTGAHCIQIFLVHVLHINNRDKMNLIISVHLIFIRNIIGYTLIPPKCGLTYVPNEPVI
jgi:hypothetical protein